MVGKAVYLSSLIRVVTNLPSNVQQIMPQSINDKNKIVGRVCYWTNDGTQPCHAVLLTPTTPPVCEAKVGITRNVNYTFSASVTLSNVSNSALKDWLVNVSLSEKTIFYATQNAKIKTSGGNTVIAQPLAKNQTIDAQGSTNFTFSGLKTTTVVQLLGKATATLGGQNCTIKLNTL